jgi:hypothetical protein
VRRERGEQGTERRLVLGGQAAEDVLLGSREALVQVVEDDPAVVGGHDQPGTAVAGVLAALDQVCLLQVIKQIGHDGPVNAQPGGERGLAARLVPGGGGQHLVAAVAAGQALGHRIGRLDVPAEYHREPPAKLAGKAVRHRAHSSMVRPSAGL